MQIDIKEVVMRLRALRKSLIDEVDRVDALLNIFGGLDTQRSRTPRAADQAAIELLRRFYDAWQAREDDEVIDALVLEMSAVLKTAAGG